MVSGAGVAGALGSGSGSGSPLGSAMGGGRDYRAEVTAIYQEHNPTKLGSLEALFQKYSGQEQKLYLMVCKKYNVTPAASAAVPGAGLFGGVGGFGGTTRAFAGIAQTAQEG